MAKTILTALIWGFVATLAGPLAAADAPATIDFNRDIRPILSNACLQCHGPDEAERQGGLRLDDREAAAAPADSGERAIVPGHPDQSELIRRITSSDEFERMPPPDSGKSLTAAEIERLKAWIAQGAPFAKHWSYETLVRPELPPLDKAPAEWRNWPRNEIDRFVLARLQREGLTPAPEADRYALIRRVSLDLTGLPPTWEEVQQFINDDQPGAYGRLVDRLLEKSAYGEHWARLWLDLARYADSAGYADDPPRTIWAYRDWVIRSLNDNKPFDRFTVEQIAGDLLPNPTRDQLIATGFHRNTQTNNEGGTSDEEFRNVAVVDRVNTTFAVWMGTTINCCQCHSHKYDPISQEEFYRVFAILNSTADADRRDESPFIEIWSDAQEQQKADWQAEIAALQQTLATPSPELAAAQTAWERQFAREPRWQPLRPQTVQRSSGAAATIAEDGTVLVTEPQEKDVYTLELPLAGIGEGEAPQLTALRIDALPHDQLPGGGPGLASGNFVVTRVLGTIVPPAGSSLRGRYVRIENPGQGRILSLAEVQVFSGNENVAPSGKATQSSTDFAGPAELAVDGTTNGDYAAKSTTHTSISDNPWWELDLQQTQTLDRIVVWNRTDNGLHTRLKDFRIAVLDENRNPVLEQTVAEPPNPQTEFALSGERSITFSTALADYAQSGFDAANVLNTEKPDDGGWAVGGGIGQAHALTLIPAAPLDLPAGVLLRLTIEQNSRHANHLLGHFRVSATSDADVSRYAGTPADMLAVIRKPVDARSDAERDALAAYFRTVAPELQPQRERLAQVQKQLSEMQPETTAPVMQELPDEQQRETHIQRRGNFLDLGPQVEPGLPAAFHPLPEDAQYDRLGLARWLVSDDNPLTPRVIANRYWEGIFGRGIVVTSEEFGSQGELPSHPELLDWLASELIRLDWDTKAFLKTIVTSATYRQSSRVTPELVERDPDNVLLARGPRFRLSAEMIRDQALFVAGLLSPKMFGPPVKPPQPKLGVNAAFGGNIDWQTSEGDDRYRRGLYTTWRRSNPYPSMATFDAPSREVCTVRRARTNTPLQALVTLNDPVYVEAAQALARRIDAAGGTVENRARHGFRICVSREPEPAELAQVVRLFEEARKRFADHPEQAAAMATKPLGPAPEGTDVVDLAAWSVVGNVLLNLDEMLMKR